MAGKKRRRAGSVAAGLDTTTPLEDELQLRQQHQKQQLGDAIMCNFAVRDRDERDFFADCMIHGRAPREDIMQMWRDSLMHGVNAWDQLFSCAQSLQQQYHRRHHHHHAATGGLFAGCDGSLEGTDLLGFIASVLAMRRGMKKERGRRRRHGQVQTSPDEGQHGEGGKTGQPASLEPKESKVTELGLKKRVAKKRSKKAAESPYWSATPASGDERTPDVDSDLRKQLNEKQSPRKVERRRSRRQSIADISNTSNIGGLLVDRAAALPKDLEATATAEHSPLLAAVPSQPNTTQVLNLSRKVKISRQPETPKRVTCSSFFTTPTPTKAAPIAATTLSALKTKTPRPPRGTVSCLPFPRLDAPSFGLAQERYTHDPFRLLIAVTFLIRTAGRTSMPVFRELMDKYPTPRALADAEPAEIELMIRHLGLSNNRTATIQKYARLWGENPRSLGCDGRDVRAGERLEASDPRESAWEIGHLTQGRYAIDSWRIFCRDVFLGRASNDDPNGGDTGDDKDDEGSIPKKTKKKKPVKRRRAVNKTQSNFQPEWMRVLPEDKELRAYLRWMWMREGWEWDPHTGERTVLSAEMADAVQDGRVVWDNTGKLVIVPQESEELEVESLSR
ncbi:uncharacterized protein B0I36DRAFT_330819 [Microdochium trichocladiopsis]|uniref:HhH-GPD domain-containing protein n=1 Tax=Microdochium trichocladiopsis TaxID=1682393 RepID=A0A9P8Y116_9PEZI|nr:uncharacterized protein B0I36DRAFT_330819 [Microdochium trichocladiopsis]KAH7026526.1 hypothetical protein B0I36DRAFT_330819 [Microdochium trichocladiopsis]